VDKLRNRQVKNFLTVTLMSLGMPMILMGDEVRHTQRGNNNAYCQDNELSWFDWTEVSKHVDVHRFVSLLNARRALRSVEPERQRVTLTTLLGRAEESLAWGKTQSADWGDGSRSIALSGLLREEGLAFHLILNAYWEPLEFELPSLQSGVWRRWIDTGLESPHDIAPWEQSPEVKSKTYRLWIDR